MSTPPWKEKLLEVLPSLYNAESQEGMAWRITRALKQVSGARRCHLREENSREQTLPNHVLVTQPLGEDLPVAHLLFERPPSREVIKVLTRLSRHCGHLMEQDQPQKRLPEKATILDEVETAAGKMVVLRQPLLPGASSLGLTGRQHQVAMMKAEGLSHEEIALSLGISEQTVANHLNTIYRLLGVESQRELFALLNEEPE